MSLTFVDFAYDYQVYRNDEGYLEGYKSICKGGVRLIENGRIVNAKDIERVVTHATTIQQFGQAIARLNDKEGKAKRRSKKDKHQLKLL